VHHEVGERTGCEEAAVNLRVKRVYEVEAPDDGVRVLVDRLWPRGLAKARAAVDLWLRDVAPSDGLRTWFGHVPERFDSFASQYEAELTVNDALDTLRALVQAEPTVTLLYGAKDTEHNQAVVLARVLERELEMTGESASGDARSAAPRSAADTADGEPLP
jgi:uncharacterized protein YeaO (DUF488 family)